MDMPVIIVDRQFNMYALGKLLSAITQPIAVFFDEFDKHYRIPDSHDETPQASQQEQMLSILDGANGGGKKMFTLIGNDLTKVSVYLQNRPGRIRYTTAYETLPNAVIRDFIRDKIPGVSDQKIQQMITLKDIHGRLNFDMMSAIVEEAILYKEDFIESACFMFGQIRPVCSLLLKIYSQSGEHQDHQFSAMQGVEYLLDEKIVLMFTPIETDDSKPPTLLQKHTLTETDLIERSDDFSTRMYKWGENIVEVSYRPASGSDNPNQVDKKYSDTVISREMWGRQPMSTQTSSAVLSAKHHGGSPISHLEAMNAQRMNQYLAQNPNDTSPPEASV